MKSLEIPARLTGTVHVAIWSDPTSCLYGDIFLSDRNLDSNGVIYLGSVEVDIPLEVDGALDKQVDQLRESKSNIIREATDKAQQIDEAIESLLAIEYKEGL
jgi:hypothetical protein